jgi:hypothetical protein
VNNLFSFLNLSFWTVYESGLWTHGVVLRCAGKTSAGFRNFARGFIDCDDITCNDFLFLDGFDHLLSQIVDGLHFGSFKSDFSGFGSRSLDKIRIYLKIFQFRFIQLHLLRFRFPP